MHTEALEKLTIFLCTDPEIVGLKKRYREITGRCLPGWNWEEYRDMDHYIARLHELVNEAEEKIREETRKS